MRIAYFTNTYPRATDTFIRREVLGLRQRGIDVRTFSVRRAGSEHDISPEILEEKRNTHYLLPASLITLIGANLSALIRQPGRYFASLTLALKTRKSGFRGLLLQLVYFQEAIALQSELKRQGVTHVHNHLGDNSGTVTLLASSLSGIGYSITIHGPHIFFDPTHWALREKVKYSRFVVCISHYCQSQMMLFSDQADWGRLKVVRCGVDVEQFPSAGVRETAKKLLYTGRLAAEKGLPVLFEGLRTLAEKGYEFELTLIGDGADRQSLETLGHQLGIGDRLVFAGYVGQDGVREFLQRSDVFILPSFAEGVPVSLMEAMACGVPVVATYVGGVVELVKPEQTGLIVSPADSSALCEALARFFDDFELRKKVSRLGREMVARHYNLNVEVDKLADLFRAHADGA